MRQRQRLGLIVAAPLLLATTIPAHAGLVLTTAGVNDGFTLTTFLSGYPAAEYGPLSVGVLPDGDLITGSDANAALYIFSDADGQGLSNALSKIPYTYQTGNPQYIFATVNGQVYGAQVSGGTFGQFSNSGAFTPIPNLTASGVTAYYGMWADPANNDLIASSSKGLIEINPASGTYRVINASVFPDGVTVSADGGTVYAEVGGGISAYNVTTGALIKSYATGHSPDGTGVISSTSALNGDLIINDNDGTVLLLDPVTSAETIIADNGTRGDFVSADTNNGTLFLSQEEQIARLSCGVDCSIGLPPPPPPASTPEPGTLLLVAAGFGGLTLLRRRITLW